MKCFKVTVFFYYFRKHAVIYFKKVFGFGHTFSGIIWPVMLTRPQPYEAEAKTHEAEAKAEARFFGLEAEAKFETKFMRQQRFEKPKYL